MSPSASALIQILALAGIVVGLAGLVLPVIPGPAVIWLSCLAWAWADGFEQLGWPSLGFLLLLAVIAQGADLILGALGARKSGVAVKSLILASLAALVGFIVFQFVGAVAAAAVTLVIVESRRLGGDWRAALATGGTFVVVYFAAMALEIVLALAMVTFFAYQVISG